MSKQEQENEKELSLPEIERVNMVSCLRIRPMNKLEASKRSRSCIKVNHRKKGSSLGVTATINSVNEGSFEFTFDKIFNEKCSQSDIFDEVGVPNARNLLNGYNCALIAYGQSGSGKTHTMFGPIMSILKDPLLQQKQLQESYQRHNSVGDFSLQSNQSIQNSVKQNCTQNSAFAEYILDDLSGLIPRVIREVFDEISESPNEIEFSVRCSYIELYLENLTDLLYPSNSHNLAIVTIPPCDIDDNYVGNIQYALNGLSEIVCMNESDAIGLLNRGNACRTVLNNSRDKTSSDTRTHLIFSIKVQQKNVSDSTIKESTMKLVELAGSEALSFVNPMNQQDDVHGSITRKDSYSNELASAHQQELKVVKRSLVALRNSIHSASESPTFPQHNDHCKKSKLTKLLSDALGGNCKATFLITASPSSYTVSETIKSATFGEVARKVTNNVVCNHNWKISEYKKQIRRYDLSQKHLLKFTESLVKECYALSKQKAKVSPILWEKIETIMQNRNNIGSDYVGGVINEHSITCIFAAASEYYQSAIMKEKKNHSKRESLEKMKSTSLPSSFSLSSNSMLNKSISKFDEKNKKSNDEIDKLKSEVQKTRESCEYAENLVSELESEVLSLRIQNEHLIEKQKTISQELGDAKSDIEILVQDKTELELQLNTVKFREKEANVFLRKFRKFYRRLLKHQAGQGTGTTPEILTKFPGVPDLDDLIDVDTLLYEDGLIEEDEFNGDDGSLTTYRPTGDALLRSAKAAKEIHSSSSFSLQPEYTDPPEEVRIKKSKKDSQNNPSSPTNSKTACWGESDRRSVISSNTSIKSSDYHITRDRSTRSDGFITTQQRSQTNDSLCLKLVDREKELLEELQATTAKCIDLQIAFAEAKSTADILMNNISNGTDKSQQSFAKQAIEFKSALDKRTNDLQAIIWKMNELHLVNKTYSEKISDREHHIHHLEEKIMHLQDENRNLLYDKQVMEENLREELKDLQNLVNDFKSPLWAFGEADPIQRSEISADESNETEGVQRMAFSERIIRRGWENNMFIRSGKKSDVLIKKQNSQTISSEESEIEPDMIEELGVINEKEENSHTLDHTSETENSSNSMKSSLDDSIEKNRKLFQNVQFTNPKLKSLVSVNTTLSEKERELERLMKEIDNQWILLKKKEEELKRSEDKVHLYKMKMLDKIKALAKTEAQLHRKQRYLQHIQEESKSLPLTIERRKVNTLQTVSSGSMGSVYQRSIELDDREKRLEQSKREMDASTEKVKKKEKRLQILDLEIKNRMAQMKEIEVNIQKRYKELKEREEKLSHKVQEMSKLEETIKTKESEFHQTSTLLSLKEQNLQEKALELQKQEELLSSERERLEAKLTDKDEEMRKKLQEIKKQEELLQSQIDELNCQLENAQAQLSGSEGELRETRIMLTEREAKLEKALEEHRDAVADLVSKENDLNNIKNVLDEREESLKKTEEMVNRALEERKIDDVTIETRQDELNKLSRELKQKQQEILEKEEDIATKEREVKENEKELASVLGLIEETISSQHPDGPVNIEIMSSKRIVTDSMNLKEKIILAGEKVKFNKSNFDSLQKCLVAKEIELNEREKLITNGKRGIDEREADLHEKEEILQKRAVEVEAKEEAFLSRSNELSEKEKQIIEEKKEVEAATNRIKQLEEEVNSKKDILNNDLMESQKVKEDFMSKTAILVEQQEKLREEEGKLILREKELDVVKEELVKGSDEEKERQEKLDVLADLKNELEARQSVLETRELLIAEREEKLLRKESELESKTYEYGTQQKELEERIAEMEEKSLSANAQLKKLQDELGSRSLELSEMEEHLNHQEKLLSERRSECSEVERDLLAMIKSMGEELQVQASDNDEEKDDVSASLEDISRAESVDLIRSRFSQMKTLQEKELKHLEELKQNLDARESELVEKESSFSERESKLVGVESKFDADAATLESKQRELEELEMRIAEKEEKSLIATMKLQDEIDEREAVLSEKEEALQKRAVEVEAKEEAIISRSTELSDEFKNELEARQSVLETKESLIAEREKKLLRNESELESKTHEYGTQQKELEERIAEMEEKSLSTTTRLKKLQDELDMRSSDLSEMEEHLNHQEKLLSERRSECSEVERDLLAMIKSMGEELQVQASDNDEEKADVSASLEDISRAESVDLIRSRFSQMKTLQEKELKHLEELKQNLDARESELVEKESSFSERESKLVGVESKFDADAATLESKQRELEELEMRIAEKEEKSLIATMKLQDEIDEREAVLNEKEEALQKRAVEVEAKEEAIISRSTELSDEFKNELEARQSVLETKESLIAEREEKLLRNESELESKTHELGVQQKELEERIAEMEEKSLSTTTQLKKLQDELDMRSSDLSEMEEHLNNQDKLLSERRSECSEVERDLLAMIKSMGDDSLASGAERKNDVTTSLEDISRAESVDLIRSRFSQMKTLQEKELKHLEELKHELDVRESELVEKESSFSERQSRLVDDETKLKTDATKLENKQRKLEELEMRIAEKEEKSLIVAMKLQDEIDEREADLREKEEMLQKRVTEVEAKEDAFLSRSNELSEKEKQIIEEKKEVEAATNRIKQLEEEVNSKKDILNNDLMESQKVKEDFMSKTAILVEQQEKLREEEGKLILREKELDAIKEELVKGSDEEKERQEKLDVLTDLKNELEARQSVLETRELLIAEREEKLLRKESELESKTHYLQVNQKELDERTAEIEEKFLNKTLQEKSLASREDVVKKQIKRINESLYKQEKVKARIIAKQSELRRLEDDLKTRSDTADLKLLDIADKERRLTELEETIKTKESEFHQTSTSLSLKEQNLQEKALELQKQEELLSSERERLEAKLTDKDEEMRKKLQEIKKQEELLQSQIDELNCQLENAQAQLNGSEGELRETRIMLTEREAKLEKALEEHRDAVADFLVKKEELKEMESYLSEKDGILNRKELALDRKMKNLELNEKYIVSQDKQVDMLQKEILKKEKVLASREESMKVNQFTLEKISNEKLELDKLSRGLKQKQQEILEREEDLTSRESEIKENEKELASVLELIQKNISSHDKMIGMSSSLNKKVLFNSRKARERIGGLEGRVKSLFHHISRLEDDLQSREIDLKDLEDFLTEKEHVLERKEISLKRKMKNIELNEKLDFNNDDKMKESLHFGERETIISQKEKDLMMALKENKLKEDKFAERELELDSSLELLEKKEREIQSLSDRLDDREKSMSLREINLKEWAGTLSEKDSRLNMELAEAQDAINKRESKVAQEELVLGRKVEAFNKRVKGFEAQELSSLKATTDELIDKIKQKDIMLQAKEVSLLELKNQINQLDIDLKLCRKEVDEKNKLITVLELENKAKSTVIDSRANSSREKEVYMQKRIIQLTTEVNRLNSTKANFSREHKSFTENDPGLVSCRDISNVEMKNRFIMFREKFLVDSPKSTIDNTAQKQSNVEHDHSNVTSVDIENLGVKDRFKAFRKKFEEDCSKNEISSQKKQNQVQKSITGDSVSNEEPKTLELKDRFKAFRKKFQENNHFDRTDSLPSRETLLNIHSKVSRQPLQKDAKGYLGINTISINRRKSELRMKEIQVKNHFKNFRKKSEEFDELSTVDTLSSSGQSIGLRPEIQKQYSQVKLKLKEINDATNEIQQKNAELMQWESKLELLQNDLSKMEKEIQVAKMKLTTREEDLSDRENELLKQEEYMKRKEEELYKEKVDLEKLKEQLENESRTKLFELQSLLKGIEQKRKFYSLSISKNYRETETEISDHVENLKQMQTDLYHQKDEIRDKLFEVNMKDQVLSVKELELQNRVEVLKKKEIEISEKESALKLAIEMAKKKNIVSNTEGKVSSKVTKTVHTETSSKNNEQNSENINSEIRHKTTGLIFSEKLIQLSTKIDSIISKENVVTEREINFKTREAELENWEVELGHREREIVQMEKELGMSVGSSSKDLRDSLHTLSDIPTENSMKLEKGRTNESAQENLISKHVSFEKDGSEVAKDVCKNNSLDEPELSDNDLPDNASTVDEDEIFYNRSQESVNVLNQVIYVRNSMIRDKNNKINASSSSISSLTQHHQKHRRYKKENLPAPASKNIPQNDGIGSTSSPFFIDSNNKIYFGGIIPRPSFDEDTIFGGRSNSYKPRRFSRKLGPLIRAAKPTEEQMASMSMMSKRV